MGLFWKEKKSVLYPRKYGSHWNCQHKMIQRVHISMALSIEQLYTVITMAGKNVSIYHGCMVWIEKFVLRVTVWHHEACRVIPNSDQEWWIFLSFEHWHLRLLQLNTFITMAGKNVSIYHGSMVWIEKFVIRVTDQHHEACRVMLNSDQEWWIFLSFELGT